jgi:hypothetical protein
MFPQKEPFSDSGFLFAREPRQACENSTDICTTTDTDVTVSVDTFVSEHVREPFSSLSQ